MPQLIDSPPSQGLSEPDVLAEISHYRRQLAPRGPLAHAIARILEVNAANTVTVEMVEAAPEMLVIGSA